MNMETLCFLIPPGLFCTLLLLFSVHLARNGMSIRGNKPIEKGRYYFAKYSILMLWFATIIQALGYNIRIIEIPRAILPLSILVWLSGFALLQAGLFNLGSAMRIGLPQEITTLKETGPYRLSRNPMYLGLNMTLISATLYTLHPNYSHDRCMGYFFTSPYNSLRGEAFT